MLLIPEVTIMLWIGVGRPDFVDCLIDKPTL
jgi:hypothetical protein